MDVIYLYDSAEDYVGDDDGYAQDEQYYSGLGEVGVSIGVTESGTKDMEEVYHSVKSASLPS